MYCRYIRMRESINISTSQETKPTRHNIWHGTPHWIDCAFQSEFEDRHEIATGVFTYKHTLGAS